MRFSAVVLPKQRKKGENMIDCGFLANIVYDYEHNRITSRKEFNWMMEVIKLSFNEKAKVVKWYNLAQKNGKCSIEHFKLVCVVLDVIKKHKEQYLRKEMMPSIDKETRKWM